MTNTYINIYSAGGSSADSHAAELVGDALSPSLAVLSGEESQAYSDSPPAPTLDAVSPPDFLTDFDQGNDLALPPENEAYESALLNAPPVPDEVSQMMEIEAPAPTEASDIGPDDGNSMQAAPAPDENIEAELAPKRGAKKKA